MGGVVAKPSQLPVFDLRSRELLLQFNVDQAELLNIFTTFLKRDAHLNGFWTLSECYDLINESRSSVVAPVLQSLFFLSSSGNDGQLSFEDLCVSFLCFCALSKEELLQLLFMVVDFDRNGSVDKDELAEFLNYKSADLVPVFPANNLAALEEFNAGNWSKLNFDEFALLCDRFLSVPFCVFHLQRLLREQLLGTTFWTAWDAERRRLFALSEGQTAVSFRTLEDGREATVTKPGRFTMKEVLEFTKRRSAVKKDEKNQGSLTKEKDKRILNSPLLNIVRNRRSAYYIHVDTEEETKMKKRLEKESGGKSNAMVASQGVAYTERRRQLKIDEELAAFPLTDEDDE